MKNKLHSLGALLLIFVLCTGLISCANGESTTSSTSNKTTDATSKTSATGETNTGSKEKYVIGLSFNALDEYQTEWRDYFVGIAEAEGYEVQITNAEGKVDKQIADVESLIARKVDLIVIRAVDSEGSVPAFEACEEKGIPTIDSGFGTSFDNTLKIISSQYFLTSLQGNYCNEWLAANSDKTLKVGYLWGAQGVSTTQARYDGWKETVEKDNADRFEILAEKVCNWSAVESMAAVEDWMQAYPEMNCIVAMSDEMAIAATNVLEAANKTKDFIVVGIDGSPNAQGLVREGVLSATVYTSKKADAQLHVDNIKKIQNGEDFSGQTIDPGDKISDLLTKDTIDEVLERLG